MKCPPSPSVSRVTDGILLKSELDHECLDVMVVERRGGKLFASAKLIDRIAAGKQTTRIKLVPIAGIKTLVGTLKKRIISAGLHKDEAQSLIDVWGDGLFNRGGLTVFYRIPQETYDRWLPLATKPVAKKEVRVGLVAHFRLEPELDALVKEFVKQLGSRDYRVRANADKRLREIGGPAYPAITEASKTSDPEVRLRCQKILAVRETGKATAVIDETAYEAFETSDSMILRNASKGLSGDTVLAGALSSFNSFSETHFLQYMSPLDRAEFKWRCSALRQPELPYALRRRRSRKNAEPKASVPNEAGSGTAVATNAGDGRFRKLN